MPKSTVIDCHVTQEEKALISDACRRKGTTESALLRAVVEVMVEAARVIPDQLAEQPKRLCRCARVSVRLRGEDVLLVRERARADHMSVSAYAARILRRPEVISKCSSVL